MTYGCGRGQELCIRAGAHHLPFLFFRSAVIDYSLDNGDTFQNLTLKMISKKCVSVREALANLLHQRDRLPLLAREGGNGPRQVQQVTCAFRGTSHRPLGALQP